MLFASKNNLTPFYPLQTSKKSALIRALYIYYTETLFSLRASFREVFLSNELELCLLAPQVHSLSHL